MAFAPLPFPAGVTVWPYFFRRMMTTLVALFLLVTATFFLIRTLPGGPWDKEKDPPQTVKDNLNAFYGLDKPLFEQYLTYMKNLAQGDFSYSLRRRVRINELFARYLPVSLELALSAIFFAVLFGVPLGVMAASYHNRWPDYMAMGITTFGRGVPEMVLSPILILVFAEKLRWFPFRGWDSLWHMVLPSFVLSVSIMSLIARLTRSSMLQVMKEDYMAAAMSRGIGQRALLLRHALRNALIPVVTMLSPMFATLVMGGMIVELFFGIPGIGRWYIAAISRRDYMMVVGTTLVYGSFYMVGNMLVDLLYHWLDPRIRNQG